MNVPGTVNYWEWALGDFRDNVYYPVRSFLDQGNPYDRGTYLGDYPVRVRFPPYTPLHLLVHLPFGLLPHVAAQLLYFAFSIALIFALSLLSLRMCGRSPTITSTFGLAALILVSRPGHWSLMLGQTTLEYAIAVFLALGFGARSAWVSSVALGFASMKPTIGIPLALLMLCQRYSRPVVVGAAVAVVATLLPTIVLVRSAGDVHTLVGSYLDSVSVFEDDPSASPLFSPSRIDSIALVSRLMGAPIGVVVQVGWFILVMAAACAAVRRVRRISTGREVDLYCIAVACLAILISLYQQSYSAILLAAPLTALIVDCWAPRQIRVARSFRPALIVLLAVPVLNHLIAARVLNSLEVREWWGLYNTVVSANGLALLLAFALYVGLAFSRSPADETQSTEMRSTSDPQIAPPSMSSAALDQCRHSDDSHWDHPK
jgi:hypothetical protein